MCVGLLVSFLYSHRYRPLYTTPPYYINNFKETHVNRTMRGLFYLVVVATIAGALEKKGYTRFESHAGQPRVPVEENTPHVGGKVIRLQL